MSIRDTYLPILDKYRGFLNAKWDLRRYDVMVRITTWAPGTLPGAHGATPDVTETPLVVYGDKRPKVEQLSQKDILASGGLYQDQDLRIGPLTPAYVKDSIPGGIDPSTFDPDVIGSNTEILFKLTGPGMEDGQFFKKVGQEITGNFRYSLIVRKE